MQEILQELNNNISEKIDSEYYLIKTTLANYAANHSINDEINKVLSSYFLPVLSKGNYPIKAEYKLPGKNHITHTKQINIEY